MRKIFNVFQINNNRSFLVVFVLFCIFSTSAVFGQNERIEVSTEEAINDNDIVIESPVKVSNSFIKSSNADFILWFMGTKEDMGKNFSDDVMYTKKSFLTSGREPNRLMVKTLLKKALNIKSC